MAAYQAPPSLGFSRQEHWSGLPLLSPVRQSEVTQSSPTPSNPMDCSPPGSSAHGIFQARVLEWGAIAFSETCVYLSSKVIQTIVFICKKSYLLSDPSIMMQKFLFELHMRTRLVIFTCSRCCWARNSDLTLYFNMLEQYYYCSMMFTLYFIFINNVLIIII